MSEWRVIHGDCLEVMRGMDAASVDAVVTDPPYGLGAKLSGEWSGRNGKSRLLGNPLKWDVIDDGLSEFVCGLSSYTQSVIIWGGQYYALPPSRCWLIWDKIQRFSAPDCEMAWTNLAIPSRIFRMSRIDAYYNKASEPKSHPTQKPVQLMEWCLSFIPSGVTVLDPFMGSGTTGVACMRTGRNFIGIEINADYCAIAERRIREAAAQLPLLEVT